MFSKAFSNPAKSKWIIQGAGLFWFLGCFLLLQSFGVPTTEAIVDAGLFAGVFLLAVVALDLIFSFYIPKGGNNWLLLILPIFLSLIGVFLHQWVCQLIFEENEAYIDLLKDSRYLRLGFLIAAEVLVGIIAIVVSKLEQQEESQKREAMMNELSKEAELTQLRQQLQPHFLFNSLNSINALVVSDPQRARDMVIQLSDFLRGTIRKDHKEWVTLEEELNYLKLYLDIERVRFGHRLEVSYSLEDAGKKMKLPQLLIQPLVENAIKHGLYGLRGKVHIEISAQKSQNYLMVEVKNPFDPETPAPQGTGFGLSAIERRLFLLFGRKDLVLAEKTENQFRVSLKIPQLK